MAPKIAQPTKPTKFLYRNQLGKLLQLIRSAVHESVNKDGSSYNGFMFPKPPAHENPDVTSLSSSAYSQQPTSSHGSLTQCKQDILPSIPQSKKKTV